MGTKNFSLNEFTCPCCNQNHIKLEFLYRLQRIRDYLEPDDTMVIVSGYRCPSHNHAVGGEDTSSHVKGLAADIKITDGGKAFRIMKAIMMTGAVVRIGFGEMDGVLTLHVDMDESKVQDWLWGY